MKGFRVSIGGVMAVLVVVAVDCVVIRSIAARPEFLVQKLHMVVAATLPMANVLALCGATLAGGRVLARPRLAGFGVGALVALVATPAWLEPALRGLDLIIPAAFIAWLQALPLREEAVGYVIVGGLPMLVQLLAGLAGGWAAARLARPPSGETGTTRHLLRAALVLVALVALPAVAVEGWLRKEVDPAVARFAAGSEAVFDLDEVTGILAKATQLRPLDGARVRIASDGDPNVPEMVATRDGTIFRDRRMVRATVLDGPRAGEAVALPHCCLRAIR